MTCTCTACRDGESFELETLSRLNGGLQKTPLASRLQSLPLQQQQLQQGVGHDADSLGRKPWDHHNNLNETCFRPVKGSSCFSC